MYSNHSEGKRNKIVLFLAAASGSALMIFLAWPGSFYFLNDDLLHIPLAASGKIGHNNSIRYVGDLSLVTDAFFWKQNPFGYHLTNLLLHLANSFLLYALIKKAGRYMGLKPGFFISIFAPLLFCFYGLHSDAIFWVIGRSASLGCLFFLLTFLLFCSKQQTVPVALLTVGCWTAALFSYESVWILPFLLILLYRYRKQSLEKSKGHLLLLWMVIILSGCYLIYRVYVTSEWLGTYEATEIIQMNIPVLMGNFCKLILRTLVPAQSDTLLFAGTAIAFTSIYGLLSGFVLQEKSKRIPWFLLHAAWLFSYTPYLSLGISIHTIESERFLYLPSLFFCIAIAYTLGSLYKKVPRPEILLIPLILLGMHVYLLQSAASSFRLAGKTVEKTYKEITKVPAANFINIKKLPSTITGIPVFRAGFTEGGKWLLKDFNRQSIRVQSTADFSAGPVVPMIYKTQSGQWILSYEFSPI